MAKQMAFNNIVKDPANSKEVEDTTIVVNIKAIDHLQFFNNEIQIM